MSVFDLAYALSAEVNDLTQLPLRHKSFPPQGLKAVGSIGFFR
jgi:hypothetical protein